MQRLLVILGALLLASLGLADASHAAGGGGGGGGVDLGGVGNSRDSDTKMVAKRFERAKDHFEQAKTLEAKLEATTSPDEQKDLEKKIHGEYDDARGDLEYVVKKQPNSYPAQSELGFALRKLGRFDDSLKAYDRALATKPGYAPAIEYRGEANLELGHLAEARAAWEKLSNLDSELADQLLTKMQRWVARQKTKPDGNIEPDALGEFEAWLAEKKISDMPPGFVRSASTRW
ncbi:MAG TPA: tetratricopeptide repeat protein [Myxococcota bacterium]|nr:tetratricopeptide repeat protein [Myxococcota bacterium]